MDKKYEWIKSNRKTIAIQVKQEGKVVVRSPYFVSKKQIEQFLEEKRAWIHVQQEMKAQEQQFGL